MLALLPLGCVIWNKLFILSKPQFILSSVVLSIWGPTESDTTEAT